MQKGEPLNVRDRAGGCERMSHLATKRRIKEEWLESDRPPTSLQQLVKRYRNSLLRLHMVACMDWKTLELAMKN